MLLEQEERTITTYKVGYLVGSLATGSINRKLAKALIKLSPTHACVLGKLIPGDTVDEGPPEAEA